MSDTPSETPEYLDYRGLGYVDNPFSAIPEQDTRFWGLQAGRAATNRLLAATDRAVAVEHSKPIWIALNPAIPVHYYRIAENGFLRQTALDTTMNVLTLNIPVEMMRLGRIRGTLAEVAELVAAVEFDKTVAAYAAAVLPDPDVTLEEYSLVEGMDFAQLAEQFSASPSETVAKHFGTLEAIRRSDEETELVLYETYVRSVPLDVEPEEGQFSEEDDANTARPDDRVAVDDQGDDDDTLPEDDPVAVYLIAYMRAHLSPVIARAMKAYVTDGFTTVAQELKITKAPKKTLSALVRFATARFRKMVVVYDQFDPWANMDDNSKSMMLAALTELRWAFGPDGVMALLVPDNLAPELEEQFASADRVVWAFDEVEALYGGNIPFNAEMAQGWLDAAALSGTSAIRADGPELAPLVELAAEDLLGFAKRGHFAFLSAAQRGAKTIERVDIDAALAAPIEASPTA